MELKPKPDWLKPLFPWEQYALTSLIDQLDLSSSEIHGQGA
jgi:hypothetical protein